eukprot:CAMPEP_0205908866 /NCGR_PEP_ID=MMETSP1325-20131115/3493_1 /ASSEMBLY_ACC=CAM_ASM_000708 /TAXON_ID=236786 /ORGANISM="Florenciella sp., Strain RCC1007" /LENGTH=206 /DNA_ID=CAMNT_0053275109 /DNA_START=54 /DNA_END=673 /DNA_ORIENTATION=+
MKVVVVGDGAVGKTCLLVSYTANQMPSDYMPTIFDTYSVNTCIDNKLVSLSLWDTAGQEDYDKLRPLSYPLTDCFILCFSTLNPKSLDNVKTKWLPELRRHAPKTPVILCGTKTDARKGRESYVASIAMNHPECCSHAPASPSLIARPDASVMPNPPDVDPEMLQRLRAVNEVPVSAEIGQQVADELGLSYLECSALTQQGLKEVF